MVLPDQRRLSVLGQQDEIAPLVRCGEGGAKQCLKAVQIRYCAAGPGSEEARGEEGDEVDEERIRRKQTRSLVFLFLCDTSTRLFSSHRCHDLTALEWPAIAERHAPRARPQETPSSQTGQASSAAPVLWLLRHLRTREDAYTQGG